MSNIPSESINKNKKKLNSSSRNVTQRKVHSVWHNIPVNCGVQNNRTDQFFQANDGDNEENIQNGMDKSKSKKKDQDLNSLSEGETNIEDNEFDIDKFKVNLTLTKAFWHKHVETKTWHIFECIFNEEFDRLFANVCPIVLYYSDH